MNKNIYLHLSALLILSLYYLFSLLIFNSVVVQPFDNLEFTAVYNHIISKTYRGDFESYKMFLSGEFKWYYLDRILFPINFLHLIVDDKQFYFLEEIIKKIISYFSFYLLGKFIIKNKIYAIAGALFYTTLVNDPNTSVPSYFLPSLPYLMYLSISKNQFQIKHLVIITLIGLNSSLVYDYPSVILMLFFSYFIRESKEHKVFFIFFTIITISMLISNIPIILSVIGEPLQRLETAKDSLQEIINFEFKNFINYFSFKSTKDIFFLGTKILKFLLIISCFFIKNKKLKLFLIIIISTYILKNILLSDVTQIIFTSQLKFLKGVNFRLELLSLFFSIILILILSISKIKIFKNTLIFLVVFSSISYQIYLPINEFTKEFIKKNMTENSLKLVKENYYNKNYKDVILAIKNKDYYKYKNLNFNLKTKNSFDSYYKKDAYKKIKIVVGTSKVASIGINPMLAAMSDINIIDGYYTLYQLSYKLKFRKIIEQELNQNEKFKNYYDDWGNRVFMFYSNQDNLLLNFDEAKNLGAEYIISSFPLKNKSIQSNYILYDENNNIYLYKII